jgi:copper(I)-binding protein
VTITNRSDETERLVAASSPRAGRVELHEMAMEGAVMRMRPAEALSIAPGGVLELAPGGAHLMFFDVTAPFVDGEQIPVTLSFERAGEIDVTLPVRRSATHAAH